MILEMLGLDEIAHGIGALLAVLLIAVLVVMFLSWDGSSSHSRRMLQGSGEVIATDWDCHMRAGANVAAGERELHLRVPCDEAETAAARYPARQFQTKRVEMLKIAYVTDRGVAVDAPARRDALKHRGPIEIGQYVSFYFDPANPKRELMGSPPAQAKSPSWGLGTIFLAGVALLLLFVIGSVVAGFRFLCWIGSSGS